MKEFRILNPRLDANFKAIFTQPTESSRKALKSFLTAAIGRDVKEVSVTENDNPIEFADQRGISYDINCTFSDGTSAQIEMQGYAQDYDYGKRAEYYAARLISSTLEVGDCWEKVPQAYQISVLNFTFDATNKEPIHHYTMTDIKDGAKLSERLNVIFMELPKVPTVDEETDIKNLPTLIKWCKFFKEADNPNQQDLIERIIRSEEGIMEAEKALKGISQERWRWIIQGQIEGKERDYYSSIHNAEQRGMKKGAQAKAIETARNFLKLNKLSCEEIALCCSLPLEQVIEIKEELAQKAPASQ